MRKDWKYMVYVMAAVAVYVVVKLLSPKQHDWSVTLASEDKDPYGTFVLHELLPGIFADVPISHSYRTLYELKDSLKQHDNILILASNFSCDKEDTNVLLKHVAEGGSAVISAQYFWGHLSDTLNVSTYDYFFKKPDIVSSKDSSYLKFSNHRLDTSRRFWFRRENIHNYFAKFDTTKTTVIAENDDHKPVTIRVPWGKGNLIMNCTPLVFTNIYMLAEENYDFVAHTLSYLPEQRLHRTEFYHAGRMESRSPLRFVLNNESLRWAYYLTIALILLFMVFEAKRKQRVIPVIKPLDNTSLAFVSTIGNLYYENNDHKNMAEKKITFLLEHIRTRYLLKTSEFNDAFITALANKSGNSKEDVKALFRSITFILSTTVISPGQLMDLSYKIERFNHQEAGPLA